MPDEELPATQDEALAQSGISATPIGVSAVVIMAGMLLSRIAGLLREQITAWLYGTGDDTAAFTVAENVLNMLLELTATGMLHGALIPVLASLLVAENGIAAMRHVSGALFGVVALILTPLVVLAVVVAPQIVDLMTAFGGTQDRDAATVDLTVALVRTGSRVGSSE